LSRIGIDLDKLVENQNVFPQKPIIWLGNKKGNWKQVSYAWEMAK